MSCPACAKALSHLDAGGGVFLDVCNEGCGGIWFDNQEIKKFDELHEHPDSPVFQVNPASAGAPAEGEASDEYAAVGRAGAISSGPKRACPRCCQIKMRKTFYSVAKQVEVDQCGGCGGYWLDAGELEKIRGENANRHPTAFEEAMADVLKLEAQARLHNRHRPSHSHGDGHGSLFGFGHH